MSLALPVLKVEATWGDNPFTASPTWTDITSLVSEVHTDRGAPPIIGKVQPGVATLLLRNDDNRFDPLNTGGPYGSGVTLGRRIRVRATLNGGSSYYPIFDGYIDHFQEQWDRYKPYMKVQCSDMLRLLQGIPCVNSTLVVNNISGASNITHYYRLNDPKGSGVAGDLAVVGTAPWYNNSYQLAVIGDPVDGPVPWEPTTAASLGGQHMLKMAQFSGSTTQVGLMFWLRKTSYPSGTGDHGEAIYTQEWTPDGTNPSQFSLVIDNRGHFLAVSTAGSGSNPGGTLDAGVDICDGYWHHLAWRRDGSDNMYLYVDGVLKTSGTALGTPLIFTTAGNSYFGGPTESMVSVPLDAEVAELVTASGGTGLSATVIGTAAGYGSGPGGFLYNQPSSFQFAEVILNFMGFAGGIPSALWDIENSTLNLGDAVQRFSSVSVADALEDIRASENGRMYVTTDGILTFRKHVTAALTSSATFGPDWLLYSQGPTVKNDVDEVVNSVTVNWPYGVPQTATDSTSIGRYAGRGQLPQGRSVSTGRLTSTSALSLASDLLAALKDPRPRVNDLTLSAPAIQNSPVGWATILTLGLYSGATIERLLGRPSILCPIERIAHDIVGGSQWDVTFGFGPGALA